MCIFIVKCKNLFEFMFNMNPQTACQFEIDFLLLKWNCSLYMWLALFEITFEESKPAQPVSQSKPMEKVMTHNTITSILCEATVNSEVSYTSENGSTESTTVQ